MLDKSWSALERNVINDPVGIDWTLHLREANLFEDSYEDVVGIKIARDSKYDVIYSAAYSRSADFVDGGTYQVSFTSEFALY